MSEPKQQPKILLRKPKKSQRSPSDPSSSLSKGDGTGGARSVSTSSSNAASPPPGPKQPLWYRFRTAIVTLLVMNAVVIGYTVFRTSSKPSETSEEGQTVENTAERDEKKSKEDTATEKAQDAKKAIEESATEKEKDEKKPIKAEIEKEKAENLHTRGVLPEPSKVPQEINLPEPSKVPQEISSQEISKQKISNEDQQELYKWLLAEKRKMKPTNKAERAQIDAEKALLKEFLRGKGGLNV